MSEIRATFPRGAAIFACLIFASCLPKSIEIDCPSGSSVAQRTLAKGDIEKSCMTSEDIRHGPFVRLSKNGVVIRRGQWESGYRVGPWTWMRANGDLSVQGTYQIQPKLLPPLIQPQADWDRFHNKFVRLFANPVAKTGWWVNYPPEPGRIEFSLYRDGELIEGNEILAGDQESRSIWSRGTHQGL